MENTPRQDAARPSNPNAFNQGRATLAVPSFFQRREPERLPTYQQLVNRGVIAASETSSESSSDSSDSPMILAAADPAVEDMLQATPCPGLMEANSRNIRPNPAAEFMDGTSELIINLIPDSMDGTSELTINPIPELAEETSGEVALPKLSARTSNRTKHAVTESAGPGIPEEDIFRRQQGETLDPNKTSRARLYHYFFSRLDKLRVLCDKGLRMTDFPAACEEDFALLKTLIKTYGDQRWWAIKANDLACPECVLLLKAKREDPKVRCRRSLR